MNRSKVWNPIPRKLANFDHKFWLIFLWFLFCRPHLIPYRSNFLVSQQMILLIISKSLDLEGLGLSRTSHHYWRERQDEKVNLCNLGRNNLTWDHLHPHLNNMPLKIHPQAHLLNTLKSVHMKIIRTSQYLKIHRDQSLHRATFITFSLYTIDGTNLGSILGSNWLFIDSTLQQDSSNLGQSSAYVVMERL